jgi:hypothetical protein
MEGPARRSSGDRRGREGETALEREDLAILDEVEPALADGLALKRWWEQTAAAGSYAERFDLVRVFHRGASSYGFFDRAPLGGGSLPVMGVYEEMLFDQPKTSATGRLRRELREFVLHYFLRVSAFHRPEVYAEPAEPAAPAAGPAAGPAWRGLSWCPDPGALYGGFGYSQHYYKLRGSGAVGKFPAGERFRVADLRELGERYEWIVLKVRIFDFKLAFTLPGAAAAQLVLPLAEESYLVVSADFVADQAAPEPGVAGRYGFGYAFLKTPGGGDPLAYGPGRFDAAFKLIRFDLLESGETRVHMAFAANRPTRVLDVSLDPIDWGFGLADLLSLGWASHALAPLKEALGRRPLRLGGFDPVTAGIALANGVSGGLAARRLCISKERLEKDFLVQHFDQHYQMLTGALLTWRQIPDWLDESSLPAWVRSGRTT